MALTQTIVYTYTGDKSSVETSANNVANAIAQNDVLAWHSKKDNMFYVVKVANKTVSNNVVDLTVYGVCFKFDASVPSSIANVNTLLYGNGGIISNSKPDILRDISVGGSSRLAEKIAYVKFFGRKTFSVSDLMFSNTSNFIDDIKDLTVIDSFTRPSGTVTSFGPEGGINGVTTPGADNSATLLPGVARQLAYSCRHSIM